MNTNYVIRRSFDNKNYLVHHGILGQKWGIRNGPPYPLYRQKGYREGPRKQSSSDSSSKGLSRKQKIAIKIAIGVGLTAAAAYAGKKISELLNSITADPRGLEYLSVGLASKGVEASPEKLGEMIKKITSASDKINKHIGLDMIMTVPIAIFTTKKDSKKTKKG